MVSSHQHLISKQGSASQTFILVLGSFVSLGFLLLPNASLLLYVHAPPDEDTTYSWWVIALIPTCVTPMEWTWMIVTTLLVIVVPLVFQPLPRQRRFSTADNDYGPEEIVPCPTVIETNTEVLPSHASPRSTEIAATPEPHASVLSSCASSKWHRWHCVGLQIAWFLASIARPLLDQAIRERLSQSMASTLIFLGAKTAWPALWLLAIVLVPLQRVSPRLAELVQPGWSHRETTRWHMQLAGDMAIWLLLHTALITVGYGLDELHPESTDSKSTWVARMVRDMFPDPSGRYTGGIVNFVGWMALLSLGALWLSSKPAIQRYSHELFLVCHWVLAGLFVILSNLHDYNTYLFLWPGLIVYLADRLTRKMTQQVLNVRAAEALNNEVPNESDPALAVSSTNLELETDGIIRNATGGDEASIGSLIVKRSGTIVALSMTLPPTWCSNHVYPGSLVYLQTAHLGAESHPFSISSVDQQSNRMTIHLKMVGTWTISLGNALVSPSSEEGTSGLSWKVEGPYGMDLHHATAPYDHCVYVAGGVGITGLSYAIQKRPPGTFTLIWLTRSLEEVTALGRDLLPFESSVDSASNMHIFVTKPRNQSEPPQHDDGGDTTSHVTPQVFSLEWNGKSISNHRAVPFLAAAAALATSFLVARTICCCLRREHGQYQSYSGFGKWQSTCTLEETSCILGTCFFCFRGLTVVAGFVLAPPLSVAYVWMLEQCCQSFRRWLVAWNRPNHSYSIANATPLMSSWSAESATDVPSCPADHRWIVDAVKFCETRPDLSKLLPEYCTTPIGRVAVVACGPHSLVNQVANVVNHELPTDGDSPARGSVAFVPLTGFPAVM